MPYQYEWDAENNTLINFYSDVITLEEANQSYIDAEPYYDKNTGLIHNIIDLTHANMYDAIKEDTLLTSPQATKYATKYRDRIGWTIFVGRRDNAVYQSVFKVRMAKNDLKMHWVDDLNEAYQFLYENQAISSPNNPYRDEIKSLSNWRMLIFMVLLPLIATSIVHVFSYNMSNTFDNVPDWVISWLLFVSVSYPLLWLIAYYTMNQLTQISNALDALTNDTEVHTIDKHSKSAVNPLVLQVNKLIAERATLNVMRGKLYEQISEAATQEERNRLARDLHDSIKQQVFSMNVSSAAALAHLEHNPTAAREALLDVKQSAQEAMVEMRALLQQLAPAPLEKSGLIDALRQQAEALSYRTGASIKTDFGTLPNDTRFPIGAQETVFRITQEALSNIARHARAKNVTVTLQQADDALQLEIKDDGAGFDLEAVQRGMGLSNIEKRVSELKGATVTMQSAPQQGTTISIEIPFHYDDPVNEEELYDSINAQSEVTTRAFWGVTISTAVMIFGLTIGSVVLERDGLNLVSILMMLLGLGAIPVGVWFGNRFRHEVRILNKIAPTNHPRRLHSESQRSQALWVVWFAVLLLGPGLMIRTGSDIWFTMGISTIAIMGLIVTVSRTLTAQFRYLDADHKHRAKDVFDNFRREVWAGWLSTGLLIVTIVLPSTSTGFYIPATTRDQWDSNFFATLLVAFISYQLAVTIGWWRRSRKQTETTTD